MCCGEKCGCTHPEKTRDPRRCTPEQNQECHGEVTEHPCEPKPEEDK